MSNYPVNPLLQGKQYRESTPPGNKRQIVFWALGIILLIGVILLVVLAISLIQQHRNRKPPEPAPATNLTARAQQPKHEYGSKYYYAGMPRATAVYPHSILVLTNIAFCTGYDETRKDPAWTCYRLFRVASLDSPQRKNTFHADKRTAAKVPSTAYAGTDYDRGHMAPFFAIALCFNDEAEKETFLMSNMLPQAKKLNRGIWEGLESIEMRNFAQKFQTVWVIDGGVFGKTPKIMKSGVAIPDKCYKIIVREDGGQPKVLAFIFPQAVTGHDNYVEPFLTSVREIEKETGLDFLSELPDEIERTLETEKATTTW